MDTNVSFLRNYRDLRKREGIHWIDGIYYVCFSSFHQMDRYVILFPWYRLEIVAIAVELIEFH